MDIIRSDILRFDLIKCIPCPAANSTNTASYFYTFWRFKVLDFVDFSNKLKLLAPYPSELSVIHGTVQQKK